MKAINNAGLRARDLVEQILAFSRMQEQMHAPVKVSPIVKEAIKLLQSSLPASILIKATIKADLPVMGDPTQIHQVILKWIDRFLTSTEIPKRPMSQTIAPYPPP